MSDNFTKITEKTLKISDLKMNIKFLKAAIIGAAFTISSVANAGLIFSDNFDPISTANWTVSNARVLGDGITEFYDGNA